MLRELEISEHDVVICDCGAAFSHEESAGWPYGLCSDCWEDRLISLWVETHGLPEKQRHLCSIA